MKVTNDEEQMGLLKCAIILNNTNIIYFKLYLLRNIKQL